MSPISSVTPKVLETLIASRIIDLKTKAVPYINSIEDVVKKQKLETAYKEELFTLENIQAKELLIMCKDCNGRGSVSDSDNDGRWESYSCERCVGSGYFYPDDLFKAIKREKLERELAALDAKDTEGNQ